MSYSIYFKVSDNHNVEKVADELSSFVNNKVELYALNKIIIENSPVLINKIPYSINSKKIVGFNLHSSLQENIIFYYQAVIDFSEKYSDLVQENGINYSPIYYDDQILFPTKDLSKLSQGNELFTFKDKYDYVLNHRKEKNFLSLIFDPLVNKVTKKAQKLYNQK